MKKVKVLFIALFVAGTLLGFSGTSRAFDLSKITAKPVELYRYVIQKLGLGDDEEVQNPKPAEVHALKNSEKLSDNSADSSASFYADTYALDLSVPLFSNDFKNSYPWDTYNKETSFNFGSEGWYLRVGSRTGEIFTPFSYESSYAPLWQTKVEYFAALPWASLSQLNAELFIETAFSQHPLLESQVPGHDYLNESFSTGPEKMEYGLRINAAVKDAKIGLYGLYVNNDADSPGMASTLDAQGASSEYLWLALNSGYYHGSSNLAASVSYELPFMSYFHQGMSPTVRLETAYRFGDNESENSSFIQEYDQWRVGMAYEGKNGLAWLNSYGINWGVGYNYTVTLDDLNLMDNLRLGGGSHSGSINANTYWFNMKLYTMFMYLYDRETRGSMTVLNATYSPDWRWSYGIRANIYYGKKDADRKLTDKNPETVTFTATYRWD